MITWSKFTTEYFEKDRWVKRTRLFMGDLSKLDVTKDNRFFDVKGNRRNTEFIELIYE